MTEIYLLQNQDKLFLGKHGEWLDGRDAGALYKTRHKDEALNQLFEVNTKDYSQRIHVLSCSTRPNGLPQIGPEDLPPPMEKPPVRADRGKPMDAEAPLEPGTDRPPTLAIGEG